ncbi:hypothetical protein [Cupriavidus malaysiensis]|uniref:Uncharacterized protein n=1 Tax=Cupriavidus malaysiensis TaxID=367825 RepID=A0ABN4U0E2_9BURK|nr:hypothetical protein [Cupriavidus malaysiensis]AOZ11076.1 hypothetical protein BKK80_34515 [Cupriavidus malaysiensis]
MNARRNFLLAVAALFVLLTVAVVSGLLAVVHAAFALPLGVMVLGLAFGGRLHGHYDDVPSAFSDDAVAKSPYDVPYFSRSVFSGSYRDSKSLSDW